MKSLILMFLGHLWWILTHYTFRTPSTKSNLPAKYNRSERLSSTKSSLPGSFFFLSFFWKQKKKKKKNQAAEDRKASRNRTAKTETTGRLVLCLDKSLALLLASSPSSWPQELVEGSASTYGLIDDFLGRKQRKKDEYCMFWGKTWRKNRGWNLGTLLQTAIHATRDMTFRCRQTLVILAKRTKR